MARLTVAIICRDEEENLPAWLESVAPVADEIVALDSGSTDATMDLLRRAGARVEHRSWTGYSDQRNACAALAGGDWILFLDADERPDQEMRDALTRLKQSPDPIEAAYELTYKVFFFGCFLRHGGFYPERHMRLYRRGRAAWARREVHERLEAEGPVGRLPGHVEHYSYATVEQYRDRMDRYSAEAARQMFAAGRRAGPFTAWSHAAWAFVNRYLLRLGFLDGRPGLLAARLEALYTLTKYNRLRRLARRQEDKP